MQPSPRFAGKSTTGPGQICRLVGGVLCGNHPVGHERGTSCGEHLLGGTSDGNFQTLGNWYTNVTQTTAASALPGASDIATFNAQGTVTNAISTLGQSLALQGMLFNSNASGNITLGTLNDFVVTLGTAGISVQAGSGSHTLNSGVTVGSTQSWTNNAGSNKVLTVAGNVTLSAT
ncbi:hypothetical protein [Verrucomicrobium spinosum]|uniref:hypothetical protein n=1 Tax=Verrucomicrobium spinosum TaxID=2736 RepID=UPI0012E3157D|nr:hypothetical protein [Verrucomicrobium spinosum]